MISVQMHTYGCAHTDHVGHTLSIIAVTVDAYPYPPTFVGIDNTYAFCNLATAFDTVRRTISAEQSARKRAALRDHSAAQK